jgi:ribosomal protein S12 methylthiotransferase
LKIADGCNHRCAYCLIPAIRGPLQVRPLAELVGEAKALVAGGVKELSLVAQDLTAWREGDLDLGDLTQALSELDGLVWLRLLYAYPDKLTKKLLRRLASLPKVTPYLDLPLQHVSGKILQSMGRKPVDALNLVRDIRELWPGVALRTTLMVGFPGETEEDFAELLRFLDEAALDHVGFFAFSPEEGTRAALLPDQTPEKVKAKRLKAAFKRQNQIARARNKARVGQETIILVEGPSEDSDLIMTGRADFQAPEVDSVVLFEGHQPSPGQMVRAKLTKAGSYELLAKFDPERADSVVYE